ncbi:MAG TPA: PLD nuclease N-terminal domain-containing protein [Abditibacteriaceae bacterium]|nr:PLD nuclease N-terminal domain-containing protein [Abditibacteriaceae bacterium]
MILLTIALTVFWIVELIDVVRREFPDPNTKILWILVILFTHPIGTIIYYFAGKPQGALPGETRRSPGASN